jgi:diguanylate cyclase (GGDEF)-like protein
MQAFRAAIVLLVAVTGIASPSALGISTSAAVGLAGVYLLVSAVGEVAWRLTGRRALWLFGAMLIVDGAYLAWLVHVTGGLSSNLRYLIPLHVIAATLLASYRTGLKLAFWDSLLAFATFQLQESDQLARDPLSGAALGSPFTRLVAASAVFWLVAIVTATFSAVNERELRRRRFDLESLASMSQQLENVSDPSSAAAVVVTAASEAFGFPRVLLVAAPDESLAVLASHGEIGHKPDVPLADDGLIRRAIETKGTQLVSALDSDVDPAVSALLPDAHNLIVVPLVAESRCIGVLIAEHSLRSASRIEHRVVAMVERFASHGALALTNAWLLERVQRLAAVDGLTGVFNRRTFDVVLEKELARADRNTESLCLVMVDLDHFKYLNDEYGHRAGDDVLCRVAGALERQTREFDTVARYGGDEFAVILPRCSWEEARGLVDRLREAILSQTSGPRATVSVGVASYPEDATEADALVAAADGAMYHSKRTGRDRLTFAAERPPSATIEAV